MKKEKRFKVWFSQVNQTLYEVMADSKSEAIEKAKKEWNRENGLPLASYVEEQE